MEGVSGLDRLGRDIEAEQAKDREDANEPDFAAPKRLRLRYRLHSSSPKQEAIPGLPSNGALTPSLLEPGNIEHVLSLPQSRALDRAIIS